MIVVEVGLKLNKSYQYYDAILKENGLVNCFNCVTHDIYYTDKNLDGMTENEMKQACIRLRSVNDSDYKIQNSNLNLDKEVLKNKELDEFDEKMKKYGYYKVFDTIKNDYHYFKEGMSSKVQIQEIENVGLLVYFDNEKYYKYDVEKQRNMLIDELNSYGFDFKYTDLGIDKLRTLYYKKEMYSQNQNG